jgi:hypothetical protein
MILDCRGLEERRAEAVASLATQKNELLCISIAGTCMFSFSY